ncbi:chaperone NapD [Ferrimonas senticii]|uniref:chaperone NapD n=1 Tax=Ferrimonas senticii TaxID=394566 RepID=UPI000412DE20|nr:chaperone NapD [Ferrimonas senticii]
MDQEYHVVSLVVHANPAQQQLVEQQLAQQPHAEVVTATEDGRYVVVIDGDTRQQVLDDIEAVQQFEGVISTALAYHQVEQLQSENAQ